MDLTFTALFLVLWSYLFGARVAAEFVPGTMDEVRGENDVLAEVDDTVALRLLYQRVPVQL